MARFYSPFFGFGYKEAKPWLTNQLVDMIFPAFCAAES
jgi:hypothetical protein